MTLEQVARAAVEELWTDAEREVDPPLMLEQLRRARRRRRTGWLAAAVAAVTVVLTVVAVVSSWPTRRATAPARTPLPTTEVLLVQSREPPGSGVGVRLEGLGGRLPYLPRVTEDPDVPEEARSFRSLVFSPDGTTLAYSDSRSLGVMELATGVTRQLRPCGDCTVAWTPSGEVLSVAVDRAALFVTDLRSGRTSTVRLPAQWRAWSVDVSNTGRVLLAGRVEESSAVMVVDLDGRAPAVLATYPQGRVYESRWSPDGDSIAFIHKNGRWDETVQAALELRVMAADGSGERVLATPGTCYCHRATPHLDWSDSGRLAVVAVGAGTSTSLHEVALDGTVSQTRGDPVGAIAWRPATTGSSTTATPQAAREEAQGPREESLYTRAMVGPVTSSGSEMVLSFAFSSDGGRVAYSTGTGIFLAVPNTNDREEIAPCPSVPCPVAWTPAGDRVVTASTGLLEVIDVRTRSVRAVALPPEWQPVSLDVSDAGRVLLIAYGPLGEGRLATLPLAGGPPTVVQVLPRANFGSDARWSPDGRTIAWMSKAEPNLPQVSMTDLVVNTVGADGTGHRRLAVVGRCACLGHVPGLDWSPQGKLAVMSSVDGEQRAFEVSPTTGRLTGIAVGGAGPVAWRPTG